MRNVCDDEPEKQLLVGSWENFCVAALVFTTTSNFERMLFSTSVGYFQAVLVLDVRRREKGRGNGTQQLGDLCSHKITNEGFLQAL